MLPLVFYFLLHTFLAADPAHFKPGALSAHLGRVSLVEDVLWVHYPFAAVVELPGTLRTITDQVTVIVLQMDNNASVEGVTRLMHDRIKYNLALENNEDLSFSNRPKRAWSMGLGNFPECCLEPQ